MKNYKNLEKNKHEDSSYNIAAADVLDLKSLISHNKNFQYRDPTNKLLSYL